MSYIMTTERNFNSQPHKEADELCEKVRMENGYFNSQPHKEADLRRTISTGQS